MTSNAVLTFLNKEGNEEIKMRFKQHLLEDEALMEKLINNAISGSSKQSPKTSATSVKIREEVDYAKVYEAIKDADAEGIDLRCICEKTGYDYVSNKGRIGQNLRAEKAKKNGIRVSDGQFTFDAANAQPVLKKGKTSTLAEKSAAALVALGYKKNAAKNYVALILEKKPEATDEEVVKEVLAKYKNI